MTKSSFYTHTIPLLSELKLLNMAQINFSSSHVNL